MVRERLGTLALDDAYRTFSESVQDERMFPAWPTLLSCHHALRLCAWYNQTLLVCRTPQ